MVFIFILYLFVFRNPIVLYFLHKILDYDKHWFWQTNAYSIKEKSLKSFHEKISVASSLFFVCVCRLQNVPFSIKETKILLFAC